MATTRKSHGIFGDPGAIAPSVDKAWRDDFIVELRLLDVPGDRIGDALMTVETHLAESGEDATEAFGDAKAYAREIAATTGSDGGGWAVGPLTVVSTLLGLLGMLVTAHAFSAWLEGESAGVTSGHLVGLGLLLALASAIFFTGTLRAVVERPWLTVLLPALVIGVLVGIFLLLREPLLTVAALPLGLAGLLMVVVGAVVSWVDAPDGGDDITAPGQPAAPGSRGRLAAALAMPVMTVVLLAFLWLLHLVVVAAS